MKKKSCKNNFFFHVLENFKHFSFFFFFNLHHGKFRASPPGYTGLVAEPPKIPEKCFKYLQKKNLAKIIFFTVQTILSIFLVVRIRTSL